MCRTLFVFVDESGNVTQDNYYGVGACWCLSTQNGFSDVLDDEEGVYGLLRAAYGALPPGRDRDDAGLNQQEGAPDGSVLVNDDSTPIPAPFDAMPVLEDPTARERRNAAMILPPWAVPDEGPIPDPHHTHVGEEDIVVPRWALEAASWRLSHADPEDVDRAKVEGILVEYAAVRERFVTPDGRDAVDELLDEFGEPMTDG